MLTGEPGAGKELAARYIHAHSPRANAPFIVVPCATIEPERMEEVLFGRESNDRGIEPGLLEQAHGGSIYFDEVADMPLGTQPKILRVLTEQHRPRGRVRQGAGRSAGDLVHQPRPAGRNRQRPLPAGAA